MNQKAKVLFLIKRLANNNNKTILHDHAASRLVKNQEKDANGQSSVRKTKQHGMNETQETQWENPSIARRIN